MIKKIVFCVMLLMMGILVGCASAGVELETTANGQVYISDNSALFDYEHFQVTPEEVAAQHAKYEKIYCNATLEDDFAVNRILIMVYPFALNMEYTTEDFSEVGCVEIQDLIDNPKNKDKPSRVICLTIDSDSKQSVLDAIKLLEKREDIYWVGPDMTFTLE